MGGDRRKGARMAYDFGRLQGTAMAHVEAFGTSLHDALQFLADLLGIVLERRTDRMTDARNPTDQDA